MTFSNIAAIIPCYNSEETISLVVRETQKYLHDIIVVDDGSQDKSARKAKESGAKGISLRQNRGVGIATKIGMQTAMKMKMNAVITLDADGAHNPKDIKNLIKTHLEQKNLLTIGNRWKRYNPNLPSSKWWANQFASLLINRISKTYLPDVACGFRIFNSQLVDKLLRTDTSKGFGFIYQSIFLAKEIGKIGYAEVDVRYDANYLFATKKTELVHLLDISNQYCVDSQMQSTIKNILKEVSQMNKVFIRLNFNSGFEYIILYPLIEQQLFVFQRQHPQFVFNQSEFIEL